MGNDESVPAAAAPSPDVLEEFILQLEREHDRNVRRPLRVDLSGRMHPETLLEHEQLRALMEQVYRLYPELLQGEANADVGPLQLPADIMADVLAAADDGEDQYAGCSKAARAEAVHLANLLRELLMVYEPLRPWTGGWIVRPEDVTKEFISELLGGGVSVRDLAVKEVDSFNPAVRLLAVRLQYPAGSSSTSADGEANGVGLRFSSSNGSSSSSSSKRRPTRLLLHVPDVRFLTSRGAAASQAFQREVAFFREFHHEIPLHTTDLVGVWDDGRGGAMQRFLVVTRDVDDRYPKENDVSSRRGETAAAVAAVAAVAPEDTATGEEAPRQQQPAAAAVTGTAKTVHSAGSSRAAGKQEDSVGSAATTAAAGASTPAVSEDGRSGPETTKTPAKTVAASPRAAKSKSASPSSPSNTRAGTNTVALVKPRPDDFPQILRELAHFHAHFLNHLMLVCELA
jgi:hypothetical protein